jgi:hypothetical protein
MARKAKVQPFSYDPDSEKGKWFEGWVQQLKNENKNISACILDRLYEHRGEPDDRINELFRRIEDLEKANSNNVYIPNDNIPISNESIETTKELQDNKPKRPNVGKFFKTQD